MRSRSVIVVLMFEVGGLPADLEESCRVAEIRGPKADWPRCCRDLVGAHRFVHVSIIEFK